MKKCIWPILFLLLTAFQDGNNAKLVLSEEKLASKKWTLKESNEGAYIDPSAPVGCDEYLFSFLKGAFSVSKEYKKPCDSLIYPKSDIYKTKYKLFIGEYDQVYIRMYKIPLRFSDFTTTQVSRINMKDSIDYQFLFSDANNKLKIMLRVNPMLKYGSTITNIFE